MSISLVFKVLDDSTAGVVAFRQLKIVPYSYPFGDQAIRLFGAIDLDNQRGEFFLVRPPEPTNNNNNNNNNNIILIANNLYFFRLAK
jgi:hypothetical protein